jgi:hypothetical protein
MNTKLRFTTFLFSLVLCVPTLSAVQTPPKTTKSAKQALTLDQVLDCVSDDWLTAAWKATEFDMMRRNILSVVLKRDKSEEPENVSLLPFATRPTEHTEHAFSLMSANVNDKTNEKNFCRSNTVAHYLGDDYKAKPVLIDVFFDDDHWTFDFSQIFRHADQFTWESGVFSNSSDNYLSVTKGSCTLQFFVSTGVPHLFRVFYNR